MADFRLAVKHVLEVEKGFSNHKSDSGGETMYGITEKVARANGYKGQMKDLPLSLALMIYKKDFWDVLNLDLLTNQTIAEIVFDIGVNGGIGRAGTFLQRAINLSTRENIKVDGQVGRVTIGKANGLLGANVEKSVRILTALASAHYINCCEMAEKNEDFLFGWLRRSHSYLKKVST
jgi:lysozyme family protein